MNARYALGIMLLLMLAACARKAEVSSDTRPPVVEQTKSDLLAELKAAQNELVTLRSRFTDLHPRVRQQLSKINELQQRVAAKHIQDEAARK